MAALFTVVELLLKMVAVHKAIAGIHAANATSVKVLVKILQRAQYMQSWRCATQ
jgi:hypothetical protein